MIHVVAWLGIHESDAPQTRLGELGCESLTRRLAPATAAAAARQ